jgi:hypothetical protein
VHAVCFSAYGTAGRFATKQGTVPDVVTDKAKELIHLFHPLSINHSINTHVPFYAKFYFHALTVSTWSAVSSAAFNLPTNAVCFHAIFPLIFLFPTSTTKRNPRIFQALL